MLFGLGLLASRDYHVAMPSKVLLINLVGLTPGILRRMPRVASLFDKATPVNLTPPLPAVTCTSQATMTTGALPQEHGIVSNGWYFRESGEVRFWMRSDRLVGGSKIWDDARNANPELRVANLFWRYCTHANCDITVTERPTYWATGRKSPDIYTSPGGLRDELVESLGDFPLFRFWGPATSIESSRWIANATMKVIERDDPDLTLTYLPHLDYDLQKYGPNSPQADVAIREVDEVASRLIDLARETGRQVAVVSEYGMTDVTRPVFLNRELRQGGWLSVQHAQNGELLEPAACRAFAACSHQVAHIYVANPTDLPAVKQLLATVDGVEQILEGPAIKDAGLDHSRSGELIAIAARDSWFAYPYWMDDSHAPDFARCVAIHDKPGHDPAEMFLGTGGKPRVFRRLAQSRLGFRVPFDVISLDAGLIRGSHGRLPDDPDEGPVLLCDWDPESDSSGSIPMTQIKRILLRQLLD